MGNTFPITANPFFDMLAKATANARTPRMFPGGEEATNVNAPQDFLAEARRYIDTSPQGAPYRNPFLYYSAETLRGLPTFWGRHPRLTGMLESAMTTLGSMGPTGDTAGENISNVARGLMAYPQLRSQHEQQQLMAPYQLASSMMGMQKTQMEMQKMQAEAGEAQRRGDYYAGAAAWKRAQAEAQPEIARARLIRAYGPPKGDKYDKSGNWLGAFFSSPQGYVWRDSGTVMAEPEMGTGPLGEPLPASPTLKEPGPPVPGIFTGESLRATKGGNLWAGPTSVVISKLHAAGMHDMARDLEATATRLVSAGAAARVQAGGQIPEREKLPFEATKQGIDAEIRNTEAQQAAYQKSLLDWHFTDQLRQQRAELEDEAAKNNWTAEQLAAQLQRLTPDFEAKLRNLREARASLVQALSEGSATRPAGSPMPKPTKADNDPLGIFK